MIGNLTRDPELRFTQTGKAVLNCGIAVNEKWTDAEGNKQESVTFVDFTIWGAPAETFAKYTRKGSAICLEAKLKLESWEKDDEKRSKIILIVEQFQFLDKKPEEKSNDNSRPENSRTASRGNRSPAAAGTPRG